MRRQKPTTRLLLSLLIALSLTPGCSHVYRKQYLLADETTPEVSFEGYRIKTVLQSRLAGYMGSKNMFYLFFETSFQGETDAAGGSNPTDLMQIDSVCIVPMTSDDPVCLRLVDKHEILDNYYSREAFLTKHVYDALELGKADMFVTVSYVVNVLDPQTREVAHRRRFSHELRRNVYRTY